MNASDQDEPQQVTVDMGGGLESYRRGKQRTFSMTKLEFDILCEGTLDDKFSQWGQILVGVCLSTASAFFALAPTISLERWTFTNMIWIAFGVVAAATFLGLVACVLLSYKFKAGSVYSDLRKSIKAYFEQDGESSS